MRSSTNRIAGFHSAQSPISKTSSDKKDEGSSSSDKKDEISSSDKKDEEVYVIIANIYQDRKDVDKAVENLNKALILNPEYYKAYYNYKLRYKWEN